jgi:serine protease Do
MLTAAGELSIEPVMEIKAVFSGTSKRHDAQVVRISTEDGADLALVKIEGFEDIPHIQDFRLDRQPLQPGSDVFLFGFPLGNYALQQGETVIASTFRGILSRVVDGYLQVDAGVHPGNSGGPVTDAHGRVVGVVFSVQALPDQSAVYTIGYAIPLSALSAIWPPAADWDK